jgi:hypothetical protein
MKPTTTFPAAYLLLRLLQIGGLQVDQVLQQLNGSLVLLVLNHISGYADVLCRRYLLLGLLSLFPELLRGIERFLLQPIVVCFQRTELN